MSTTHILSRHARDLLARGEPDPSCKDGKAASPAPGDVTIEVMRLDGRCLVVDRFAIGAKRADLERRRLAAEAGVIAASVTPAPSITEQPDRRADLWALDELGVPQDSDTVPWPTASGVKVAVLDTGVDSTHPDLSGAVIARWGEGSSTLDPHGHGTHVAGTIAARGGNRGVVGVAPETAILDVPIEVGVGHGRTVNIGRPWPSGLVWAVNQGARVVNMSFGDNEATQDESSLGVMSAAIDYAVRHDVLLVAAAGNCGPSAGCKDVNEVEVPAAFSGVLGVGAVDAKKHLAGFSTRNSTVDLVAPGVGIVSDAPGTGFATMQGTSMATPHVVGAAAVLRATDPSRTAKQITSAIVAAADELPARNEQNSVGAGQGLLDLKGSLELVRKPNLATPTTIGAADPRLFTDQALANLAGCVSPCGVTGRIPVTHPKWGPIQIITFGPKDTDRNDDCKHEYVFAVDATATIVWAGGLPDADVCPFEFFAPAGQGESEVHSPVDAAGRIFLEWNPGRYNGVSVLVMTPTGFDDLDTLPLKDYNKRFYSTSVTDSDHDGVYELMLDVDTCYLSCAGGPNWQTRFAWSGRDFAPVPEKSPVDCGYYGVWEEQPNLHQTAELRDVTVQGTTCFGATLAGERFAPPKTPVVETLVRTHDSNGRGPTFDVDGWHCDVTNPADEGATYRCTGHGNISFSRFSQRSDEEAGD